MIHTGPVDLQWSSEEVIIEDNEGTEVDDSITDDEGTDLGMMKETAITWTYTTPTCKTLAWTWIMWRPKCLYGGGEEGTMVRAVSRSQPPSAPDRATHNKAGEVELFAPSSPLASSVPSSSSEHVPVKPRFTPPLLASNPIVVLDSH